MRSAVRWGLAAGLLALFLALFLPALKTLFLASLEEETLSHTILIPLVSIALLGARRREVFPGSAVSWRAGAPFLLAALLLLAAAKVVPFRLGGGDALTLVVLSAVAFVIGSFALLRGPTPLRRGLFPLLFLLFAVPLPTFLLERVISFLQHASAALAASLFGVLGTPFQREGDLLFHLPGLSVLVAEECSGIRSTIALLITSTLAAWLYLRRPWTRATLVLAVIPLAIFKNALRIVTLTLLALKVDPSFVGANPLHKRGGGLFFAVVLVVLGALLLGLRWAERKGARASSPGDQGLT